MLPATSQSNDLQYVDRNLRDMDLVVKVYWPEASHAREGQIIEKACQIMKGNDAVDRHLPDLICSHDFEEYSTKRIHIVFGIATESHCVLWVMLFLGIAMGNSGISQPVPIPIPVETRTSG
jgi:hypothetical protein